MINKKENEQFVLKMIQENNIPREDVDDYKEIIQWFTNTRMDCKFEPNLELNCKQARKGYKSDIKYENGRFYRGYSSCEHTLYEKNLTQFLKNYSFSDYNPLDEEKYLFEKDLKKQINFYQLDYGNEEDRKKINKFISTKSEFENKKRLLNMFFQALKDPNKKGAYIYGPLGVGKTNLLKFFALIAAKSEDKTVAFTSVAHLISKVKESFNSNQNESKGIPSKLQEADILFLDDIGGEPVSQWMRDDLLFNILNYRMENKKLTYFTSNLTIEELKNNYLQTNDPNKTIKTNRLIERIKFLADNFVLKGTDHRNNK